MLTKRRTILVATAVCLLLSAASLAAVAQAVTGNVYTLPIAASAPPGHLSADSSGKIWAGPVLDGSGAIAELLAVNPASNQLTVWTHQNTGVFARSNFQGTAVDSLNRVWFGGGLANGAPLVSRLDPSSGLVTGWPALPSDFNPDPQGRLWLALNGAVGRLDPATNVLTTWAVAALQGVASDAQSRGWFVTQLSPCARGVSDSLAVVDPIANTITTWTVPVPSAPQFAGSSTRSAGPRAITVDAAGKIWAAVNYYTFGPFYCDTYLAGSAVVVLDPATNVMKLWPCPTGTGCSRFTTISVDPQGKAWLTEPGGPRIARLDLNSNPVSFVEYGADALAGCANPNPVGTVADLQGNGWSSYLAACSVPVLTQLPP
jgi:hypothetical protein